MWIPLNDRIDSLPLILAGPIVRRVERDSATIWIALKEARTVTLRVYTSDPNPSEKMVATAQTAPLGEKLHVLAITTQATASTEQLDWGAIYVYNLFFGAISRETHLPETADNLTTPNILIANPGSAADVERLVYPGFALPSFTLPPASLTDLRLIHASCRKPHGERLDAFEALDTILASTAKNPQTRPHQLFLTGDQIYADDVADALLHMVSDAGKTLLGWTEAVPDVMDADTIRPGRRADVILGTAGLTPTVAARDPILTRLPFIGALLGPTTIHPETAKSHLITLGEYYGMYLFAWSTALWVTTTVNAQQQIALPAFDVLYPGTKKENFLGIDSDEYERYQTEEERLRMFFDALPKVRRALANMATYMIFDDHEITDDWYLNAAWCERVLPQPLGRFIIRNSLLAYAVFQAWGNTPDRFAAGQPGRALLDAAAAWAQSQGSDATQITEIDRLIDLPELADIETHKRLIRTADSLHWHYQVSGPTYEILVLDTRTWRAFPGPSINFASLISSDGFQEQIVTALADNQQGTSREMTLVISPAPVLGVPFLEEAQRETETQAERFASDTEAWGLQKLGFERLLGALAERISQQDPAGSEPHQGRIVLLSGDVHYGCAIRLQYWSKAPFQAATPRATNLVVSQLTASSLKNETADFPGTLQLHTRGYVSLSFLEIFRNSLPDPMLRLGWANSDNERLQVGHRVVSWILGINSRPIPWTVQGTPAIEDLAQVREDSDSLDLQNNPDWRYRVDYLLAENEEEALRDITPRPVSDPTTGDRLQALRSYLAMSENHADYVGKWGDGKELVGVNNLGEVTFNWGADDEKYVIQKLWWRLESSTKVKDPLPPHPLTKWNVSLRFADPRYPRPEVS